MIKIRVYLKKSVIVSLEISGHSSNNYGTDIVCAGVSAVVTGGINALLEIDKKLVYKLDEGYAYVEIPEIETFQTIARTIVVQLGTISESSKKVQIKEIKK